MSVSTAMLTLLLLCSASPIAPACAPVSFLILQEQEPQGEPFLQWDGETEDAYRRALHLWKVRGKPAEAADILLGLADSTSVTQLPGQASWVLVLAAQCLAEAGRHEQAAKLIPGIERGAKGTKLETWVKAQLQLLPSFNTQTQIDEAFLSSLLELLNQEDAAGNDYWPQETRRFNRMQSYGRSILPYFLTVVDRWPSESVKQTTVTNALAYGLAMADSDFVDQLIMKTDLMTSLSHISILPLIFRAMDEVAERERTRYLAHYCTGSDRDRARAFMSLLSKQALELNEPEAMRMLRTLLEDSDPELDRLLVESQPAYPLTEPSRDLLVVAARSLDPSTRRAARSLLARSGELAQLRELARDGDCDGAVVYLIALTSHFSGNRIISHRDKNYGAQQFIQNSGFSDWKVGYRGTAIKQGELPHEGFDGFDFCRPYLDEPEFRTLLALAAISVRNQAGFDLAYSAGVPSEEESLLVEMTNKQFLPRGFAQRIPAVAHRIGFTKDALYLLVKQAPESVTREILEAIGFETLNQSDRSAASALISNGRAEDLLTLTADQRMEANARRAWLATYVEEVSDWWLKPAPLMRVAAALPAELDRIQMRDMVASSLRHTPEDRIAKISADELLQLLEQLEMMGYSCYVSAWITQTWNSAGEEAVSRFATDMPRLLWTLSPALKDGMWPFTAPVLYALERGVPITALRNQTPGLETYFMKEDPALLEAARVLLSRSDEASQRVGLECLARSTLSVDGLWELAREAMRKPALASLASHALQRTSHMEELLLARLEAWRLPDLQDRTRLLEAIANSADPRVVPTLLEATANAEAQISAIARAGLDRLKGIEEQRAFWESWQATGVGGSPEGALLKQVLSENREVRLAAIQALGAMKSTNALPLLISLLEDSDTQVVNAARRALAWISEPAESAEPPK